MGRIVILDGDTGEEFSLRECATQWVLEEAGARWTRVFPQDIVMLVLDWQDEMTTFLGERMGKRNDYRKWNLVADTDRCIIQLKPIDDLMEHEDDDCVCKPDQELLESPSNIQYYIRMHHSLDGRELL